MVCTSSNRSCRLSAFSMYLQAAQQAQQGWIACMVWAGRAPLANPTHAGLQTQARTLPAVKPRCPGRMPDSKGTLQAGRTR